MDREYERETIKSTCGLCAVGCGILAHVRDDEVIKVEGDPDNPLNRGELCPKGLASLEYLYHPDRLTQPLIRVGKRGSGKWNKISWDEALEMIASELKMVKGRFGVEAVAFIHGAAKGLHDSYVARLANVFGTPNVGWQGHVCFVPRILASKLTYGFYAVPDYNYPPSCIMVWGKNMADTLHHAYERTLKAVQKGARLIVIDPRQIDLATKTDLWLQLRPGSDLAIALGMINVIINENLFDNNFVEKWTTGFGLLQDYVKDYSPEKVEKITWVPAKKIMQSARAYATAKSACIQWGNAIEHGVNSFQTARAICILRAITGNLGAPGGEIQPISLPLLGRRSPELELWDEMPADRFKKRVGAGLKVLPMFRYVQPQSIIKAIIEGEPYAIHAVYIQGANPLMSYSNAQKTYEALMKLDFLAVADMFMTPTASLADIVLPVTSYLEFDSIVTPPYSYPVILIQQKIIRTGQCLSDYEIMARLAKKLGLGDYFWDSEEECLNAVLKPAGLSFNEFRKVAVIPGTTHYRKYETSGFETPSGKVELYSNRLKEWELDPLPTYREPPETPFSSPELAKEYPLTLASWKSGPFRHSGGRSITTLRSMHPEPIVTVHPETAQERGIKDGDWVYIETVRGRIRQKAHVTSSIDPRVVGVDYAWWFPETGPSNLYGWKEANINILTDDRPPFNFEMGSTNLRGILCRISKA